VLSKLRFFLLFTRDVQQKWDFLHGATVEDGTDEDQYYEEAVESEEEASDGSWSRTLRVPAQRMSPLRHVSRV
jgi:hypothetical protein